MKPGPSMKDKRGPINRSTGKNHESRFEEKVLMSAKTGSQLVYFAAERTLFSWVRAALGLMIFGFAVDRLGLFLGHYSPHPQAVVCPEAHSLWAGTALVVMGVAMNVVASVRYTGFIVRYRREGTTDPGRGLSFAVVFTLLITIAVSIIVILLIAMSR